MVKKRVKDRDFVCDFTSVQYRRRQSAAAVFCKTCAAFIKNLRSFWVKGAQVWVNSCAGFG